MIYEVMWEREESLF
jgi:hypothetical protein